MFESVYRPASTFGALINRLKKGKGSKFEGKSKDDATYQHHNIYFHLIHHTCSCSHLRNDCEVSVTPSEEFIECNDRPWLNIPVHGNIQYNQKATHSSAFGFPEPPLHDHDSLAFLINLHLQEDSCTLSHQSMHPSGRKCDFWEETRSEVCKCLADDNFLKL